MRVIRIRASQRLNIDDSKTDSTRVCHACTIIYTTSTTKNMISRDEIEFDITRGESLRMLKIHFTSINRKKQYFVSSFRDSDRKRLVKIIIPRE